MGTLTTGVFLVGFAVELQARNLAIGVLAAAPFFVQLLQIPGVLLIERVRDRRAIAAWVSAIGRSFLLLAAATPFLPGAIAIGVLIGALAVHQGLGAIGGCAWNSWMRDLVPQDRWGRFFGRRTALVTALGVAVGLIGSLVVDLWKRQLPDEAPALGYSALFVVGALSGLYGVRFLLRIPEPPMAPPAGPLAVRDLLATPFRDANFRRLMYFLASWAFAVNLAAPFFAVYMLRSLGYTMTTVMALTIASQLSNVASVGVWGRIIDRYSSKAVLSICAPLFLFSILAWTITGLPWSGGFTLPLIAVLHVLMGISTAGVGLASGSIAMRLSPAGQSTAYLAANSVITSLCAGVAPILGGACADFFAARALSFAVEWQSPTQDFVVKVLHFHSWTFFFGLAFLAGLYSLHRLTLVREIGELRDRVVLQHLFVELRRTVYGLSSVAGLVRLARYPVQFLRVRGGE